MSEMLLRCSYILLLMGLLFVPATAALCQDDFEDILSGFEEEVQNQEVDSVKDALSGFDDELTSEQKSVTPEPGHAVKKSAPLLPAWLDVSGIISMGASYNFAHKAPATGKLDHRGFSRLRTGLDLTADLKLPEHWQARLAGKVFYDSTYSARNRSQYPQDVLDQYEDEIEFTEMYLQGSLLPDLDIKFGRQVAVWGKSDNIRVTDILNPIDNREPGVVDMKDLRLPLSMTKLDYYTGSWNISSIIVHEFKPNKEPVFGNDFFPGNSPAPTEDKPSVAWDNQEYAAAINGIFPGWDISFYGAWLWNDQSHFENTPAGIRRRHNRMTMLGSSINIVRGNWLFKGEAAYLNGLEYSINVGEKQRMDTLLGAEYTGFSETVVSFELANRHLFSFDNRLKQSPVYAREDDLQYVLRVNRDFFNDALQVSFLLSAFNLTREGGSFQRLSAQYDWSDSIRYSAGIIGFQNGSNAMFQNIADNDRLFAEIRYSF